MKEEKKITRKNLSIENKKKKEKGGQSKKKKGDIYKNVEVNETNKRWIDA